MKLSLVIALVSVCSCGGWIAVDGYDAAYVDVAPVNVEAAQHYTYEGGEVYVVNGGYYHRANDGRWVRFRSRPPEARVRVEERRQPAATVRVETRPGDRREEKRHEERH